MQTDLNKELSATKSYLNSIRKMDHMIKLKRDECAYIKSILDSVSAIVPMEKVQGSAEEKRSMENNVNRLHDLENEIDEDIDRLVTTRKKIYEEIENIEEYDYAIILNYRYLCFYKWEEIASRMNYSFQWVHKLHNKALEKFIEVNETGDSR